MTDTIETQKDTLEKQKTASKIQEEAINKQKYINQIQKYLRDLSEHVYIEKIREDMSSNEEIEKMSAETLRKAEITFAKSKKDLLKYLDVNKEYGPEVRLEAVITFLVLIIQGEVKLTKNEKDKILTSLLDIIKSSDAKDWRTQLKVREKLIELGRSEQFKGRFIWRELKDIISKKDINDHVKENAARILATLGKADDDTREVLMEAIKKGDRSFRSYNAAIALIEMGEEEGLKHISESVELREEAGFWAAYLLGQLLMSEKKQSNLDVIEDDLVNKVIEQLEDGSTNKDFNKYTRNYAKRVVESLKKNWVINSIKK